jgi:hypothetical protein
MSKRGSRRGRPAKDKKKTFKAFRASNRPTRTSRRTTTKFDDSGRESGIAANQTKDRIKSLEQSVGSLDRRIEKALEAGNTDLAKDLRSRLNVFTTRLGDERAIRGGGVLRSGQDGRIVRTSDGRPVLTSKGLGIFEKTKDMDFLDPTRNLINNYPDQYAKMYPVTDQLRQGLPGIRIAREFLGMDEKKQKYTDDDMPGIRYPLDKDFGAGQGMQTPEVIDDFDKSQDRAPDAVPLDTFDKSLDVAPPGVPFQTMIDVADQPSFPTKMNPTEFIEGTQDLDKNVALGQNYKTVDADTFVPPTAPFVDPQRVNPVLMDSAQKSFQEQMEEFNQENQMQEKAPAQMTTVSGGDFQMQQKDTAQRAIENIMADPTISPEAKKDTIDYINSIQTFTGPSMLDMIQSDAGQTQMSNPTEVINQLNAANPESEAAALEVLNSLDNQNRGFNLLDFLGESLDANPNRPGFQLFNLNPNR